MFNSAAAVAVTKVTDSLESRKPLQECIEWLLPLDEERIRNWQVWIAFWAQIASDPELLAEQQRRGREAFEMIQRAPARDRAGLEVPRHTVELQASRLLTIVVGIATNTVFDLTEWPPERQRAVLANELTTIAT